MSLNHKRRTVSMMECSPLEIDLRVDPTYYTFHRSTTTTSRQHQCNWTYKSAVGGDCPSGTNTGNPCACPQRHNQYYSCSNHMHSRYGSSSMFSFLKHRFVVFREGSNCSAMTIILVIIFSVMLLVVTRDSDRGFNIGGRTKSLIFTTTAGQQGPLDYNVFLQQQSGEEWDHNHYCDSEETDEDYPTDESGRRRRGTRRNLLVVQLCNSPTTHAWARIASKPNRAYARHWGYDYLFTCHDREDDKNHCTAAQLVWDLRQQQEQQQSQATSSTLYYDAVVMLAPNTIITNMDYDLLSLLPEDKLVTVTTTSNKNNDEDDEALRMINLRHHGFPALANAWIGIASSNSCGDVHSSLRSMAIRSSTQSNIRVLIPSDEGFVEPRLIKIVDPDPNRNRNVLTILQTTADSVCYRYYPRCDVL
jgi:hypothetical protein